MATAVGILWAIGQGMHQNMAELRVRGNGVGVGTYRKEQKAVSPQV